MTKLAKAYEDLAKAAAMMEAANSGEYGDKAPAIYVKAEAMIRDAMALIQESRSALAALA